MVVGDVMVDVSVRSRDLSPGGDVHGEVRLRAGGSGANAAVWAVARGARVRLHGRVGRDVAGRVVAAELEARGVETALAVDSSAPTGAMLVVHGPGERSMVADRGANAGLASEDLPERLDASAVLVSAYLLFHPGSEPAFRAALDRADARHVAVDASSWPLIHRHGADRFFEATKGATLLLANEREAATLLGRDWEEGEEVLGAGEAVEAARSLAERYAMACVKLGRRGAVLAMGAEVVRSTPPSVEERDPTGAGDAFDGTFLAAVAAGAGTRDALEEACAAGAGAAASAELWP